MECTNFKFYEATPRSIDSIGVLESYESLDQYRIFILPIGRDLPAFGTVRVLLTSLADVAETAQKAFDEAGIPHRDISVGNIKIIRGNGGSDSGHLIDWDHCLPPGSEGLDNYRSERAGTWQFMSVHLLQHPDGFQSFQVADNKESFFWVLYYTCLRYLENDRSSSELYEELVNTFNYAGIRNLRRNTRGEKKEDTLLWFSRGHKGIHFTVAGLDDLFVQLARALATRYDRTCTDIDIANYHEMLADLGPDHKYTRQQPYYKRKQLIDLLATPTWLQDTLRKHAQTIPLPSHPHPSSSSTAYDYHLNPIIHQPIFRRNHFARMDGIMAHGLTGNIYYRNILFL